jgi:hypothetical protein
MIPVYLDSFPIILQQLFIVKFNGSDSSNADLKPEGFKVQIPKKARFFSWNLSSSSDNNVILAAVKRIVPLSYRSLRKLQVKGIPPGL